MDFLHPEIPDIDKKKFRAFRVHATSLEQEGNKKFHLPKNKEIITILNKYD